MPQCTDFNTWHDLHVYRHNTVINCGLVRIFSDHPLPDIIIFTVEWRKKYHGFCLAFKKRVLWKNDFLNFFIHLRDRKYSTVVAFLNEMNFQRDFDVWSVSLFQKISKECRKRIIVSSINLITTMSVALILFGLIFASSLCFILFIKVSLFLLAFLRHGGHIFRAGRTEALDIVPRSFVFLVVRLPDKRNHQTGLLFSYWLNFL